MRKPVSKTSSKPEQIKINTTPLIRKTELAPDSRASEHALLKIARLLSTRGDEKLLVVTELNRHADLVDADSGQVKTEVKTSLDELNINAANSPIVLSNLQYALRRLDGLPYELLLGTEFHRVGEDGGIGRKARQITILRLFKKSGITQKYSGDPTTNESLRLARKAKGRRLNKYQKGYIKRNLPFKTLLGYKTFFAEIRKDAQRKRK